MSTPLMRCSFYKRNFPFLLLLLSVIMICKMLHKALIDSNKECLLSLTIVAWLDSRQHRQAYLKDQHQANSISTVS